MNRYWEIEDPEVIDTGVNILRLFPKAGKLQVSQPNWVDKDGTEKVGKTVTLDLQALYETIESDKPVEFGKVIETLFRLL